jgi:hypothetical protein
VAGIGVGVLELGESRARAGAVETLVEIEALAVVVELRPHLGDTIRTLVE